MQSDIIKLDNNGAAYAVVKDIAEYCEVDVKATRQLVLNHIDEFNDVTNKLQNKIGGISNGASKDSFKVPELKLIKKRGTSRDEVDWSKTKLYQPHIELLLMMMKKYKDS
jgi:hypothetical protein